MQIKRWFIFWVICCFLIVTGGTEALLSKETVTLSQTKETIVYITRTGEKYHKDGCRYLRQSKIKTTKKEAVKNGYEACKICKP